MSNSPFDPNSPLFAWYQSPPPPQPVTPSLAELLAALQPPPQPKPFDLSMLSDLLPKITLRPKIFVSYRHATDQYYYNAFSRVFHDTHECVYDGSLDDEIDSDDHDYIKQRIRDEYITGTSCTVVLVGPTTYQRKHIDWEIKATLDKEHGLIGIQLPSVIPDFNGRVRVPTRLNDNINSGYAVWQGISWQQLIANPALLKHHVADACARPKYRIVNSHEIMKRNG